jgi:hypothetical protein
MPVVSATTYSARVQPVALDDLEEVARLLRRERDELMLGLDRRRH